MRTTILLALATLFGPAVTAASAQPKPTPSWPMFGGAPGRNMAAALSVVGYCRVIAFTANTSSTEALAVAASLFLIVALSIVLGAALPIFLEKINAGASNAATTIQVVMDVSGVLITCAVCGYLLDGTSPLSVLLPGVAG